MGKVWKSEQETSCGAGPCSEAGLAEDVKHSGPFEVPEAPESPPLEIE